MKSLALLTTNVAMDYLEKHERTAHTSRNLCPNKFGQKRLGVQNQDVLVSPNCPKNDTSLKLYSLVGDSVGVDSYTGVDADLGGSLPYATHR